jgi:hypothetical protein
MRTIVNTAAEKSTSGRRRAISTILFRKSFERVFRRADVRDKLLGGGERGFQGLIVEVPNLPYE